MSARSVHGVAVRPASEPNGGEFDAAVLVTCPGAEPPAALREFLRAAARMDAALGAGVALLACPQAAGGRLVLAPAAAGPYDDVRGAGEAAREGVRRALAAGARRPALLLRPLPAWPRAALVQLLGALEALYVPLQIREDFPDNALVERTPEALGVYAEGLDEPLDELIEQAVALETARGLARDIGGADPERMTPLRVAEYVTAAFAGGDVTVSQIDDPERLEREYPLFAAVNRAASSVPRHRGVIVFLEYTPKSYEQTVMLVGKGVTYDTGGCDIKSGGVMAGMSRDKCGAAAVAGFLKACELLKPPIKAVGALALVRNSVGEEAYVADELIRSRRGLAVRIGNTDAEGRLAMADLLAQLHERAGRERAPHLYTVATLTGHAVRAYGEGYTAALDNHVAARHAHADALRAHGELLGDMIEVSRIRREDLAEHRGRCAGDDLHQAGNCASSAMPRGHQAPAAFLLLAAGLHAADVRVPYTHLDVAASAGCLPADPTAAPLLALAAHYALVRR